MNCPRCASARHVITETTAISAIDAGLGQQRRVRMCKPCGATWETVEMSAGEISRLRQLAHQATMAGVAR
jgi:transcriptional regulator NrdR family protein